MAKRSNGTQGKTRGASADIAMGATMQRRLVAFAERLGTIAGTVQAKAQGLTDHDALSQQIAGVRDGAELLLAQLSTSMAAAAKKVAASTAKTTAKKPAVKKAAAKRAVSKKAVAKRPVKTVVTRATVSATVDSQAAKLRAALPMEKSSRRRGRA